MYRTFANGRVQSTDPEEIFRLRMATNWDEDTFSFIRYVDDSLKLFSGMGINEKGQVFRKKHGWWFADNQYSVSDFSRADNPRRAFRRWKFDQKILSGIAARMEMSEEFGLPIVSAYDAATEMISFKGVDGDLTFKMYFTQGPQRERLANLLNKVVTTIVDRFPNES